MLFYRNISTSVSAKEFLIFAAGAEDGTLITRGFKNCTLFFPRCAEIG